MYFYNLKYFSLKKTGTYIYTFLYAIQAPETLLWNHLSYK
jgi:hypothetical protein